MKPKRFLVMARWPSTPPGQDPIIYDVAEKEIKDKKGVVAFVGFLMDSTMPYQISITDKKQLAQYMQESESNG